MTRQLDAIFENGVLRPLEPLDGIAERAKVRLSIDVPDRPTGALADCVGIMPAEDAAEMLAIVTTEFERVDLDEWK